jgi:hypothetical protein
MRKISPSKARYEQTHPFIGFRTTAKEKEKIELLAETTGKTISQIITEMLQNAFVDLENTYNEAYDAGSQDGLETGYAKGKAEYGVKIPCNICGKDDIFLIPNSEWHKHIIGLLKSNTWGHKACHEKGSI